MADSVGADLVIGVCLYCTNPIVCHYDGVGGQVWYSAQDGPWCPADAAKERFGGHEPRIEYDLPPSLAPTDVERWLTEESP